jgi:GT2 family glycosyltransferase
MGSKESLMKRLNPLNHPICLTTPNYVTPFSTWHEHMPFAMFLVDVMKPKIIVELGTAYGASYFAFCHAVKELNLVTRCYAIDTWQGDPQSGYFKPEILIDLRSRHDPLYGSFSRLIQSTFDEALPHFNSGTIDILHIDGYHIYEMVKHDFESWLPRVSSNGIVLLHDINVLERDYGARKFWDEISVNYPHFEFLHCHGLGVLAKKNVSSEELQEILNATPEEINEIRTFFYQLGNRITNRIALDSKELKIQSQRKGLSLKDYQIVEQNKSIQFKDIEIRQLIHSLEDHARQIENLKLELETANQIYRHKDAQYSALELQIKDKNIQIGSLEFELQQMQNGITMQILRRYYRVVNILVPKGTFVRSGYNLGLTGIRVLLNEGWGTLWGKTKRYVRRRVLNEDRPCFPNLYRLYPSGNSLAPSTNRILKHSIEDVIPIDIVTVTYNCGSFMRDFAESLKASNYPSKLINFIVIDNGSIDNTLDTLNSLIPSRYFNQFRVIKSRRNLGYGRAINQAVKEGNAPYIFVVNPDIKFEPNCLSTLVEKALHDDESWLWEVRQLPYEHPKYYDPLTFETLWSSGAAFLVRRDKFIEIGGFDKVFYLYADDVDLSFRIWNSGGKCRYVPEAVLWHYSYAKPYEVKPKQWYNSLKNNLLLRYKYGRISEIIKGYQLLLNLFICNDAKIKHYKLKIINMFLGQLGDIPTVLWWRLRNRNSIFNRYLFLGWDYEIRRLGDFYENSIGTENPLVTIIVRTLNRPSYLRDALKSIINQTYRPIEIIVVEDGPATSDAVIQEFTGISGVTINYLPFGQNRGRSKAGNEGLRIAKGEFINFLDDDDLLYPDHIEVLVQALLKHKLEYKAAYSAAFNVKSIYTKNCIQRQEFSHQFFPFSVDELKIRNLFPIQAVLFHRSLWESAGGLDTSIEYLEDWDLWLKYSQHTSYLAVDKTTSEFRIPIDPVTNDQRQLKLDQAYSYVRRKYSLSS